jgi:hypothetical protein
MTRGVVNKDANFVRKRHTSRRKRHKLTHKRNTLGNIIATYDSIFPNLTFALEWTCWTSWGRACTNTIVHKNPNDTRVPKVAFIIFPGSSSDDDPFKRGGPLLQQDRDYPALDDLVVYIFTLATHGIFVNKKLLKPQQCCILHSGDIIQVNTSRSSSEYLRFKCQLHYGPGKNSRSHGQLLNVAYFDSVARWSASITRKITTYEHYDNLTVNSYPTAVAFCEKWQAALARMTDFRLLCPAEDMPSILSWIHTTKARTTVPKAVQNFAAMILYSDYAKKIMQNFMIFYYEKQGKLILTIHHLHHATSRRTQFGA